MAYSYKCNLSFGLVFIPIKLVAAAKSNDIGFNMIDGKTMSRIKYVKTNGEGNEVKNEDIVKGYEYEDGHYVIFSDSDFEKIKTPKDKNIEIDSFVPVEQINPVFYNKPYYAVPVGAEKAFAVLLAAMKESGRAAIAKSVLGTKETLIAIRPVGDSMVLNTLYFADEIQADPYKAADKPGKKELDLAKTLIESMCSEFDPAQFKDEYRERLQQAIQAKIAGQEIETPSVKPTRGVSDLMEALQKSLKNRQPKNKAAPKHRAPSKPKNTNLKVGS